MTRLQNILSAALISSFICGVAHAQVNPQPMRQAVAADHFTPQGGSWHPNWTGNLSVSLLTNPLDMIEGPWCKDCSPDGKVVNLPWYEVSIPVNANEKIIIAGVSVSDEVEESTDLYARSVSEAGLPSGTDWYPASRVQLGSRTIEGGRHVQHLRIYPIQVNGSGTRIRKAGEVSYQLNRTRSGPSGTMGTTSYATTSVLSSGEWFKIAVTSEGIYKLDYDYLTAMGIDPADVDPRTIKLYSYGGGMLSQVVGNRAYDDLPENAILVSGESDGTLDPSDYVLFYGASTHKWQFVPSYNRWFHHYNVHSDTTFYFLTFGGASGRRLASVPSEPGATATATSALNYSFYEKDIFNPLISGRVWLGESFDFTTDRTFSFDASNLAPGTSVDVHARLAARSNAVSNFQIKENGTTYHTTNVPAVNTTLYGSYWYRTNFGLFSIPSANVTDGSLDLQLTYSKPLTESVGYLDYIEVQSRQLPDITGKSVWFFNSVEQTGPGEVLAWNLQGGNSGFMVWDVSDPVNVASREYSLAGSTLSFSAKADTLARFVAFLPSSGRTPADYQRITNQDLHAAITNEVPDYLLVTHPAWRTAAERLADFHREELGHTVLVTTPGEIFNEFGGGSLDPSAMRDCFKMAYEVGAAAGKPFRYVLLFGDGSYDPKNRVTADFLNFIPTYQSRKSMRPTECYTSDDFFGFLDDGEGFWGEEAENEGGVFDLHWWIDGDTGSLPANTHSLDISIGRIPVGSADQAESMVDKLIKYVTDPTTMGTWRNKVLLVADHKDADGVTHISQADSYTALINTNSPCTNVEKVYMDNYAMVTTASGTRFPDGKSAMLSALDEGSLIANYTGHGGETGWSNSQILDIPDINHIDNSGRLPAFVTATCEFGRWDDPSRRSGAEEVFLRDDAGAIAMFTTVRVVYAGPNYVLNTNFYRHAFTWDTVLNRMPTMGEVFRKTKNASWLDGINNRNFTLMGDPGISLAYPELKAIITEINGVPTTSGVVDTLGALTKVSVRGRVEDASGTFLNTYNGDLKVTVFDKPTRFITKRAPFSFLWQKNKVFVGQADVVNGEFFFEFVVPLDISYEDGNGKISLYFDDNNRDGAGCTSNIYIGGSDSSSITDNTGPELDLYLNDLKFVDGGLTNPDPIMFADAFDENGINTVGTGVGHELTGILDDDEENVIILNDYYTAAKNSYQRGTIRYPFSDLPAGEHSLRVKIWDVANNSAEGSIRFVVADDAEMALGHVLNYPNPFTTNTTFMIEHNKNGSSLEVQIKIYTVSGTLVKSMEDSFYAEGNLYTDLQWDGLDQWGDAIGRGVYVYQVTLRDNSTGQQVNQFEKLVLLR
jgi:hypothetical protein